MAVEVRPFFFVVRSLRPAILSEKSRWQIICIEAVG